MNILLTLEKAKLKIQLTLLSTTTWKIKILFFDPITENEIRNMNPNKCPG
jgi:hypothetical protein